MTLHRDDISDEETDRSSTSSSANSSEKTTGAQNKTVSDEDSTSDTSSSSLSEDSESETEPEVDLRRSKILQVAKDARKKVNELPAAVKKKPTGLQNLPTQQPVTNSLKKDLQRTRVVRKNLETTSPSKPKTMKDKKNEISEKVVEKKSTKKPQAKKPSEDVPKKRILAPEVQQKLLESVTGIKTGVGTVKKKTATNQKKKISESAPSLKSATKHPKPEEDSSLTVEPPKDPPPKAVKRQTTGSTQKKKLPEPVPTRRLAVKKTEETSTRPQRPAATVKTDGRPGVAGRTQGRKVEPTTRTLPRNADLRGPQSRTAFTMSGPRQVAQVKNLVKERLIGQSDQA